MKIAFVSLMRLAPWGGSEELWSKTALHAVAAGHSVETLTYGWSPESPRITKLKEAGINTKFYYDDSLAVKDRLVVRMGLKLPKSEIIPPMQADVFVISNGNNWDFTHFRYITDKIISLGKPYLLLIHNTFDSGYNLMDRQRAYAIETLAKAAKRLFVSERNRKGTERQLAASVGQYHVISNPVSIQEATIRPFPASDKLTMACVGSLTCDSKGQDLLLEALSSEEWQLREFQLKIYGAGPDKAYLQHLVTFYKLQDKVTLEGHVSKVDRIWETNQVLVLPSVYEGVPMVVVEAMLSGRAVLGTDVGGVECYVVEDQTGFMVGTAKAKYLAVGLEKLWNSRSALKQMGENAFYHALAITNPHPEQSFLDIIEAVYKESSL